MIVLLYALVAFVLGFATFLIAGTLYLLWCDHRTKKMIAQREPFAFEGRKKIDIDKPPPLSPPNPDLPICKD